MLRWIPAICVSVCACASASDGADTVRQIEQRRRSLDVVTTVADTLNGPLAANVIVERPGSRATSNVDAVAVWVEWIRRNPRAVRRPDQIRADGSLALEVGSIFASDSARSPTGQTYVTHWARDATGTWRVIYDAVIDRTSVPAPTPSQVPTVPGQPLAAALTPSSLDSVIVDARRGLARVMATIQRAGQECGRVPDGWQRELVRRIVDLPVDSFRAYSLTYVVPAVAAGSLRCRDLGVQEWVRSALYSELDPGAYAPMIRGLGDGAGYFPLSDMAQDTAADPTHRQWAVETLVGRRTPDGGTTPIALLPGSLAEYFRFYGLPVPYVESWLPMLLAAVETREATAFAMIEAVSSRPEMEGAPHIVRIVGANVQAYDYRFSALTRSTVASVLDRLSANPDLPPDLAEAVRETLAARADRRNHLGVAVRQLPLEISLEREGNVCRPEWPQGIAQAVEAIAPGFRTDGTRGCEASLPRYADFNGDGAQDATLRGFVGERIIQLAVIGGDRPRAVVVAQLGSNDYAAVEPPGTYLPGCGGVETFIFPNDYLWVSYDEKSSTNFRYNGDVFEDLPRGQC